MNKIIMKRFNKPQAYTVKENDSKYPAFRINLHKDLGLQEGDRVYQVLRPDGIIELWPEEKINLQDFD